MYHNMYYAVQNWLVYIYIFVCELEQHLSKMWALFIWFSVLQLIYMLSIPKEKFIL